MESAVENRLRGMIGVGYKQLQQFQSKHTKKVKSARSDTEQEDSAAESDSNSNKLEVSRTSATAITRRCEYHRSQHKQCPVSCTNRLLTREDLMDRLLHTYGIPSQQSQVNAQQDSEELGDDAEDQQGQQMGTTAEKSTEFKKALQTSKKIALKMQVENIINDTAPPIYKPQPKTTSKKRKGTRKQVSCDYHRMHKKRCPEDCIHRRPDNSMRDSTDSDKGDDSDDSSDGNKRKRRKKRK
jgi:hypothetical protein